MKDPLLNYDPLQSIIINNYLEFEQDSSRNSTNVSSTNSVAPSNALQFSSLGGASSNESSTKPIKIKIKPVRRGRPKKNDTDAKDSKTLQKRLYARKYSQNNKKQHENKNAFLRDLGPVLQSMEGMKITLETALPQHQDMIQKLFSNKF